MKVLGFAGYALLITFFAMFVYLAAAMLFSFCMDGDVLSLILAAFSVFVAWMIWSIRKDTLS